MAYTKDDVIKALSTVKDPDLGKDLVTLNMIKDVKTEDGRVSFTVVLTTPACPLKEMIRRDCIEAVQSAVGEDVPVDINMESSVTSSRPEGPVLKGVKNIIAVASGKGGVGKSTVAANLAVSLQKSGAKVGLIDADIFGPSMPTMFDVEDAHPRVVQGEDGKNHIIPIKQYGIKLISIGFLTPSESAVVWRGPMASSALKQFITDVDWGELDYLIVDLPPGTSDIHLTLVQTLPVTGAVIVTTPQKVALADAQKGLGMFRQPQINVPVLGIIENMAYFTPAELPDNKYYIFGEKGGERFAEKNDVPLLGQIPIVQSIRESGDEGKPAALKDEVTAEAFSELAENVARYVAIRNASAGETKVVDIKT